MPKFLHIGLLNLVLGTVRNRLGEKIYLVKTDKKQVSSPLRGIQPPYPGLSK